jgi:LysM domain
MSVMSAAEASQTAGASPEIPSQPLRIIRSAARQDDPGTGGTPLDTGDETSAEEGVVECGASALRVTQVRMVREVRVSTLRAGQTRPGIVSRPRATRSAASASAPPRARMAPRAVAPGRTQVAGHAQVTGPSVTAGQEWGADQALEPGRARVAQQVRVTRQSRVTRQARVTSRGRVTSRARVAQRPGPVRLTRRGRRVVAGFVIGVIIVAATVLWMSVAGSVQASSQASTQGSPYRGMTQVVVRPGQTLWSIAAAAEPSGNMWAVVQQIINVNALSSANVQAGQLLWVPRG